MKKMATIVLAVGIAFSSMAGSAAAAVDTPLETAVDKLIGIDYRYGGTTTNGFDCSGFTGFVFKQFDVDLPRRSIDQAKEGVKVDKDELRPGDLVFFNTNGRSISHVGIYMGDGMFAHSSSKKGVRISSMKERYYVPRYVTSRRVLSEEQYQKFASELAAQAAALASDAKDEDSAPVDPEAAANE